MVSSLPWLDQRPDQCPKFVYLLLLLLDCFDEHRDKFVIRHRPIAISILAHHLRSFITESRALEMDCTLLFHPASDGETLDPRIVPLTSSLYEGEV